MLRRPTVLLAALACGAFVRSAPAQEIVRPWSDWRTIETEHFVVHYPIELAAWTEPVAARLESVHEAVTAFVGYPLDEKTVVIVHDPVNVSNGSAWPGVGVILWPTPPEPESSLEQIRGWGEILSVHEIAHIAHLARPSRNPRERFLFRLLPIPIQPIMVRTPRWAAEGYATLIEGRLTGSGRPHGTGRPTVLRRWALEGRLPSYEGLNSIEGFRTGEMAYLVGSAFLEWLVERSGEESLPHLWRRLTARKTRDFDEAFAGVFGGPPAELYGRFTVELTKKAVAAEEVLVPAGLAEGELVQRLQGWSEDPAISPDGKHVALFRRLEIDTPAEIVVWTTAPDTLTAKEREAERLAIEKDPEDVPGVPWRPRPRRAVARLGPSGGRGPSEPRWMPDGERILVVRWESPGDRTLRPDLFEWRWRDGDVRRVTRGAGIREADPDPDGRTAVGHRCLLGACDLVRVDLASGAVTVLAAGEPDGVTYANARVGPDGRIVASVKRGDRWRLGLFEADGTFVRHVDPEDGGVRFSPAFLPGGDALAVVSDRSGAFELERLDLATGATRQLTRTTGGSFMPEPDPATGAIWFLSLTTHGYDLRCIHPDPAASADAQDAAADTTAGTPCTVGALPAGAPVALDPELSPAAPVPTVTAPLFEPIPVSPRPYGLGLREHVILPLGHLAPEGWSAGAIVHGSDRVGQLGWTLGAMAGEESAWRGASVGARWRGLRPELSGTAFWARQQPSEQSFDFDPFDPALPDEAITSGALDVEMKGGALELELGRDFVSREWVARIGGSAARLERIPDDDLGPADPELDDADDASRRFAYAELEMGWLQRLGEWRLTEVVELHGAAGETGDEDWRRGVARARLWARKKTSGLGVEAMYGATDPGPGGFESFAFGGVPSPIVPPELLSQRLESPAVPVGYAVGNRAAMVDLRWEAGGLATYYRWLSAGDSIDDWKRITGLELTADIPASPLLGLPGASFRLGYGRSLDEPFENENRFYLSLRYGH